MTIRKMFLAFVIAIFSSAALLAITPGEAHASWRPAQVSAGNSGAVLRNCYQPWVRPVGTSCKQIAVLKNSTKLFLVCQEPGQAVSGPRGASDTWYYAYAQTGAGPKPQGYIAGAAVDTKRLSRVVDECH